MDNVLVTNTSAHKHLGITFSNSCNWAEHIENISAAAWTRLNLLRVLKFNLKRKSLEKIYTAFISPLLEHKLVIFYKIFNGLTPDYLLDIVPPRIQESTPYNLRDSNSIRSIRTNTNIFFHSFFPSTIRAWNDLSDDIKTLQQLPLSIIN